MTGLYVDIEKKLRDMVLRVKFDTRDTDEDGWMGNAEPTGTIVGLLGASGCGKSMTLKCIAGIVKPDRGRIVLNDRVLFDSERHIDVKVQKRRVGYLFQNYALFPGMTVRENIRIAVQGDAEKKNRLAEKYLKLLRIEELADSYPTKLSGGQQQRVALARVLASEPDVLMLDEPFSALDYYLKEQLQIELLEALKEFPGVVLMVSHSRDEVYRFCSRIHVLEQGSVVVSGLTREVFQNPKAVAAARLTGCKNIVPVRRINAHQLEIPAWNLSLKLEREIPDWVDCIGIRAHDLIPVTTAEAEEERTNVIACNWDKLLEDPFEVTGILQEGIWWKMSKERWKRELGGRMPECLRFPEKSILLLQSELSK